jgi:hypothetical protein
VNIKRSQVNFILVNIGPLYLALYKEIKPRLVIVAKMFWRTKKYEGVSKSFRTGRLEPELQMVQPLGAIVWLFCEPV